jgi:hypothetical protein
MAGFDGIVAKRSYAILESRCWEGPISVCIFGVSYAREVAAVWAHRKDIISFLMALVARLNLVA